MKLTEAVEEEDITKSRDMDKVDSLLLSLASGLSFFFSLLRAVVGDIPSLILFFPLLILGWLLPIYVGYFKGGIHNNLEERFRGWIYLIEGCFVYAMSTFIDFMIRYPRDLLNIERFLLLFIVVSLILFIGSVIIINKVAYWFLKIRLSDISRTKDKESEKRLVVSTFISTVFLAIGLQCFTSPWLYAIISKIVICRVGAIVASITYGIGYIFIGSIFYRTSEKWSFVCHNSHLLEIRKMKGRVFLIEKVATVAMITLLLFLQFNAVVVFIGILIILALLLYFLTFYSEIWELEIEIKESELDKISRGERESIVKFKREHEEAKKRISLFIRER